MIRARWTLWMVLLSACDGVDVVGPEDAPVAVPDGFPAPLDAPGTDSDAFPAPLDAPGTDSDAFPAPLDAPGTDSDASPTPLDATISDSDASPAPSDASGTVSDVLRTVDVPVGFDAPALPDVSRPDAPSTMDVPRVDAVAPADVLRVDLTSPVDVPGPLDVPVDVPAVPARACTAVAGGGSTTVARPTLMATLADRYHEGWLASPAVADLDRDGTSEIIVPREGRLVVWRPDGSVRWAVDTSRARIWAPAVVGNFVGDANLEVAVAAGGQVFVYTAAGALAPGFPVAWRDEIRGLAAGDLDADGRPEIIATTTDTANPGGTRDLFQAFRGDGSVQRGFPPNRTGASMCDSACDLAGAYDQNLAVGPIDTDAAWDVFAPHDNAYMSWHMGSGEAFRAAVGFRGVTRVPGVRWLHDLALSRMGYAPDESTALQAHFTNSPPAIADLDGDGTRELVVLASVQNAAQTNRRMGVALWVLRSDASRHPSWVTPFHVPTYLSGLSDLGGNIVAATNQVSVGDLDPGAAGMEMVFAGFDGRVHCVSAARAERWSYAYTTSATVLTGGVLLADLSGDGRPEVVFATYSTASDVSALYVLDAQGALLHRVALPGRGAMAVPTIADVNRDGALEILVSLKDATDRVRSVLVFSVAGSSANCLLWPTGRANLLRNGYVAR